MPVQRPARDAVRIFASAAEFRAWLEANHDRAAELFVGYYRRGVDKAAMSYPESVEEALCFGWIDGITYRIDDEVRATRFTPRRRDSVWSAPNLARVAELRAAGRMHPAGIRAYEERDRRKDAGYGAGVSGELPRAALARLRANRAAWAHWQAQSPSYRRQAAVWVNSAVRAETRERRLATLIADSESGRPIKPLSYGRAANGDG